MKNPLLLCLLAFSSGSFLTSCEVVDGGGYTGPYYGNSGGYSGSYARPSGYYNGYDSNRYYGSSYYGTRGRYNSYDRDHDHDHDDHRSSSNNRRDNDDRQIKLIGGSNRDKPNRPDEYHSVDWYKNRGYNLNQYKYKDDDGDVHKAKKSSGGSNDDHKHSSKKH